MVKSVGCGVWGVGCGVWGVGCWVLGVGCGVWGVGFGIWGWGVGSRFQSSGLRDYGGKRMVASPTGCSSPEVHWHDIDDAGDHLFGAQGLRCDLRSKHSFS